MVFFGKVKDGVVVYEGPPLAEGTVVRVEPVTPEEAATASDKPKTLSEKLLELSGILTDLPPDFARNHDHYIHGTPKK